MPSIHVFSKLPFNFYVKKVSFLSVCNFSLKHYRTLVTFKHVSKCCFAAIWLDSTTAPVCTIKTKNVTKNKQNFYFCNSCVTQNFRRYSDSSNPKTMVRILNVAEKNDAAKNLAEILSRGGYRRREGFSKYNKIYEFDTMLQGQQCQMIMTSVSGHLLNQSFIGNYKSWHGCNPLDLFDAPVVKVCMPDMEPVKRTLEREARNATRLIIWTDCDREGENIGFEIITVCKEVNRNLQVNRAKFSEITFRSVTRAFENLELPDERQNNAVEVRSELDLRIGAAFTRFQTLRLQRVFPEALAQTLISYGSCQFPTLGFVVERYKAIEDFIPEQFWKIKVFHELENCVVEFHWSRVRLFDQLACQVLLDKCLERTLAVVKSVKSKMKSKWRPLPLDTVELEKLASRKLRLNAKETMRIAEKLYTSGFISYPRTETNIFPKELNLRPLIEMQTVDANWGDFASRLLQNGPTPRQGTKSDQAHPPIHPTKHATNLHGNEQVVYEFVVRHFLACCDKDAKGTETVVRIDVAQEEFSASGLIILERNYLDVYPYDKWSDKEMPQYEQGQEFEPTTIEMIDGTTSPPHLLTEADLIALMEKHGIGTDATHADHIETIKNRLYVGLRESRFVPGELGMGLVEGYDTMGFQMSKPNLRAELEADLKRICEGTKDPNVVLREQIDKYRNVFREALRQASKIDVALAKFLNEAPQQLAQEVAIPDIPQQTLTVMKCPSCGSDIVLKSKRDNKGFFLSCQGYPTCKAVIWFPETVIAAQVLDERCPQCRDNPRKLKFTFSPRAYTPILPNEYEACVGGCDVLFMETLDIRSLSRTIQRRENQGNGQSVFPDSGYSSNSSSSSFTPVNNNRTNMALYNRTNVDPQITRNNPSVRSNNSQPENRFGSQTPNTNVTPIRDTWQAEPSRNTFGQNRQGGDARGGSFGSDWDDDDENAVVCNCHENAIKLTVRKEGPNTGRQFYKCAKPQGQGCNFFLWADDGNERRGENPENSNRNGNTSTGSNTFGGNARGSWNSGYNSSTSNNFSAPSTSSDWGENDFDDADQVSCHCGINCKRLTTMKEGPNKGRQFYTCPKTRDEQCGYFQWVDEMPPGTSSRGKANNRPSRGSSTTRGGLKRKISSGSTPRKRKCGICGEEGHNRKNCPRI